MWLSYKGTPETWDSWERERTWAPEVVHRWRVTMSGWIWGEHTAEWPARPALGAFTAPVPLLVANTGYAQQLCTNSGIVLTGFNVTGWLPKLPGMTHKQHRYHRYFQNTSYCSNNSGLEKCLMLLDLKTLTNFLTTVNIHSFQRETIQTNNKHRNNTALFSLLPLLPPNRVMKYSSLVYQGSYLP